MKHYRRELVRNRDGSWTLHTFPLAETASQSHYMLNGVICSPDVFADAFAVMSGLSVTTVLGMMQHQPAELETGSI